MCCAGGQTGSLQVGNEQRHNYGHSLVDRPLGPCGGRASDGVGIVSSRLDLSLPAAVRQRMPVAEHRRLGFPAPHMAVAAE